MEGSLLGNCRKLSQTTFRKEEFTIYMIVHSYLSYSGQLLLCVPPSSGSDTLQSVKWHPEQADTLAIASYSNIYLIDLVDAAHSSRGQPLAQSDLHHVSQVFSVPSVSFISLGIYPT